MVVCCTLENSGYRSGCKFTLQRWILLHPNKSRYKILHPLKIRVEGPFLKEIRPLCDLFVYFLHLREVFNQGKVMCCDLRSVGDMRIYLRLLSSSPQILCIRPRLCSLHHCKALPSIHKYDEQQQLHKMMKCTYLQL